MTLKVVCSVPIEAVCWNLAPLSAAAAGYEQSQPEADR
jgi:hypothetical protein